MSVNCQHSKLTEEDLAKLEQTFKECRHPDGLTISFVAAEIGVPSDEIQVKINTVIHYVLAFFLTSKFFCDLFSRELKGFRVSEKFIFS